MTPEEQARFPQLAFLDGLEFANGVIEAEIAGAPPPGSEARGFVGIAFRLQIDFVTYDAFYLRPTNGPVMFFKTTNAPPVVLRQGFQAAIGLGPDAHHHLPHR